MSDYYNAFEMSPVPAPGPDAVAPEPFRGIYGMPAFATIPATDLAASADFWVRGLGFFELFAIPGRLVHLRRWAFQDVLLVTTAAAAEQAPAMSVSFACLLSQLDSVAEACRALRPGSASRPEGHAVEHPRRGGSHAGERADRAHRREAVRSSQRGGAVSGGGRRCRAGAYRPGGWRRRQWGAWLIPPTPPA